MQGEIYTTEPVKVTYVITDGIMVIKLNGIAYAVIEDVQTVDDVSLPVLGRWVAETYYDGDYLSTAYVPGYYKAASFRE